MNNNAAHEKLVKDVRVELGNPTLYPDVILWPNVIGNFVDDRGFHRKVGVANPGGSDLIGIFRRADGVGMWIGAEIKTGNARQSNEQKCHEQLIQKMGGSYVVLRSVEDARAWIQRLRKGEQ